MRTLTLAVIGIIAAGLPGIAAAQSTAPVVSGRTAPVVASAAAAASSCRTHQTGASDCTHDRNRSRRVAAAWLGIPASEEAAMTERDWAEIDKIVAASGGSIHNRINSMLLSYNAPTAEEVASAGAAGTSCHAEAIPNPSANRAPSGAVHLALRTKGSCHWAYGSKKRRH